jgi:SAM-dependent methyltransferase
MREQARAVWSLGDYTELARRLEPAARDLVRGCGVGAGQRVADVAAGNGNVAVSAARAGAQVVASDLTPAMVELGRARTEREGLAVEWLEADAEALPFPDASFDRALSAFGAMFVPRPERAAAELVRVLRPDGALGMANWTPDGYPGQMFAVSREYQPVSDELPAPTEWGRAEVATERLGGLVESVRCEVRHVPFRFESLEGMLDWFERVAGPSRAAREGMPADLHAEMRGGVLEVAARHNRAEDGSVAIDAEYLLVVARGRR